MSTTKTRERSTAKTPAARPARSTEQPIARIVVWPPTAPEALAGTAAVVVIEPTETGDIGELFDLWDEEDSQGDPEEQQRSLDLLMRRLDEDRS